MRTKVVIETPKTVDEFNSWTKVKQNKFLKQQEWNVNDITENIRLNNLTCLEWLIELGY